tara:strand:+ start:1459 stop:2415 length:957 start_codon:yes stop_codon:yes gene_type:complete
MELKKNKKERIRNLVTGGAGFLGSHLVDKLMENGEEVICLDNLYTGSKSNIEKWFNNTNFEFLRHDVVNPLFVEVDRIWHLACPASPQFYQSNPIKTVKTSFLGSLNMLGLAKRIGASILLASTSEIYGDPEIHPQPETYRGCVNTVGERSCYDEGKRISETLFNDYQRMHNVDIKIARIFNTYGPRMSPSDGRVVSNFVFQALNSQPLTLYGDGTQTRSFCYVDDLISGLVSLMNSDFKGPVNLGNPEEFSIIDFAKLVRNKIDKNLKFVFKELPSDDPLQRKPVISLAERKINWKPKIGIDEGLNRTIQYFQNQLN